MAYECRRTLPMRMTVTIVVRRPDKTTLERRTKCLRQRVKDLGAEVRLLRWEQRAGWLGVVPQRRPPLPWRGFPVETGTVARSYPWSAGTLTLEGGVQFGVAASAPVTFTSAAPRNKNRHMCWYGLLAPARATACACCSAVNASPMDCASTASTRTSSRSTPGPSTTTWAAAFGFAHLCKPGVVIWDLHESDERDHGAIFAALKAHLVAHLLAYPGRAAFTVDKVVTVTEDELGARTLGDLVRRGRHFGLEVHVSAIPLGSRIIAIADGYRQALSDEGGTAPRWRRPRTRFRNVRSGLIGPAER
jgi:hypothetical protein